MHFQALHGNTSLLEQNHKAREIPPVNRLEQYSHIMIEETSNYTHSDMIHVIVPNGMFGGSRLEVVDPRTALAHHVIVPAGLQPGMYFLVRIHRPLHRNSYSPVHKFGSHGNQEDRSNELCKSNARWLI